VRTLVRVDTNHHCSHRDPPRRRWRTAAGTPDSRGDVAFLLRATPQRDPDGRHLVRKPDRDNRRQAHRKSDPSRRLTRLREAPAAARACPVSRGARWRWWR
jgi:hypothetical protein